MSLYLNIVTPPCRWSLRMIGLGVLVVFLFGCRTAPRNNRPPFDGDWIPTGTNCFKCEHCHYLWIKQFHKYNEIHVPPVPLPPGPHRWTPITYAEFYELSVRWHHVRWNIHSPWYRKVSGDQTVYEKTPLTDTDTSYWTETGERGW